MVCGEINRWCFASGLLDGTNVAVPHELATVQRTSLLGKAVGLKPRVVSPHGKTKTKYHGNRTVGENEVSITVFRLHVMFVHYPLDGSRRWFH